MSINSKLCPHIRRNNRPALFVVAIFWFAGMLSGVSIATDPPTTSPARAAADTFRHVRVRISPKFEFARTDGLAVFSMKFPEGSNSNQKLSFEATNYQLMRRFRAHDGEYCQFLIAAKDPRLYIDFSGMLCKPRSYSVASRNFDKSTSANDEQDVRWLIQDGFAGPDIQEIVELAAATNVSKAEDVARWAFELCRLKLKYVEGTHLYLSQALEVGKGDCTEFSDLFISLCRARGVAARACFGYAAYGANDFGRHEWAEVFDETFGWITVDPTAASNAIGAYNHVDAWLILIGHEAEDPMVYGAAGAGWYQVRGNVDGEVFCTVSDLKALAPSGPTTRPKSGVN